MTVEYVQKAILVMTPIVIKIVTAIALVQPFSMHVEFVQREIRDMNIIVIKIVMEIVLVRLS